MEGLDALYAAAIAGDADAKAKLEMEADILNDDDETILHVESRKGNADRVRFILREFANKNLLGKLTIYKHTALHWAIYRGHTEVAEIIVEAARDQLPETSFQEFLRQGDKDNATALHAAVTEKNVAIVKLLVEADPSDPHTQNDDGKTPMFIAVEEELEDIVMIISTTCTDPFLDGPDGSIVMPVKNMDQVNICGGTLYKIMGRDALRDAVFSGDADVMAILEMKADILENILHIESESGNTEHVQFILSKFGNKNLLDKLNRFEQTALHLAVDNGHTQVAALIIEAARKQFPETSSFQDFLRRGDQDMDTALHCAVMERNVDIVKLLVEADPTDPHTQNEMGRTPMYMAVEEGYNEIVELISTTCTAPSLDGPDGSTVVRLDQVKSPGGTHYKIMDRDALFDAAIAGDGHAFAKLEMEADKLDRHERTILHIESMNGNTEHVRFILREFADKDLLVKLGDQRENALAWAAYFGHTEVVELLIEAARHLPPNPITSVQAYLRHADQDSETALHAAIKGGSVDAVKLLVEADPTDTHIQNKQGKTPMYMAVENGYNEIVELISKTCKACFLDGPDGSTTLHAAVKNDDDDSIKVVRFLIDAAKRLPCAPNNDITDSNAVTSFQSASDNDNNDDGDSTDDHTDPNRVTSSQSSSDDDSTDDNPVSPFQAFLRRVDEDGNTALHIAVMQRNLNIANLLVESDPSFEGTPNQKGRTPFYIAVEKEHADIAKMLCTTCATPHFLVGPGGNLTALHAVVKNLQDVKDVIKMIIDQIRKHNANVLPDEIFYEIDEDGYTVLEVAVELNQTAVVDLVLDLQHPAAPKRKDGAFISLIPVIYKAQEKGYKNIVDLLTQRYNHRSKLSKDFKDQVSLISAIKSGKTDTVVSLLSDAGRGGQRLVTFVDKLGWTALHHAVYHESVPIIKHIAEAQKGIKPKSGYKDKVPTPFHVAVQRGLTSIVILLMQLWPSTSSTYTAVDKKGQNILHLAALQSKKDMIEGILKNCPAEHKKEFVNKQNNNGYTTLHLLIQLGCFVPELLKYQGLDTSVKNNEDWTPWDMLYVQEQIVVDQVKIKLALDHIQIDGKKDIFSSSVFTTSEREKKDVKFREKSQEMIDGMLALMKETGAVDKCYVDAIGGDPISRAALETEAHTPNKAGETILHVESKKGAVENVQFILSALEWAMSHNHVNAVEQILLADPAYQDGRGSRNQGLLRLIYQAMENKYNDKIVELLSATFQTGIDDPNLKGVLDLIIAIQKHDAGPISQLLRGEDNKHFLNFVDSEGWTLLHHAAYHQFDSILSEMIEAQEKVGYQFVCKEGVATPFHVAARCGHTSTVIRLLRLWPASSQYTAVDVNGQNIMQERPAAPSPFTAVDENGQNILHLAALTNKKEMVNGILRCCPPKQKNLLLFKRDVEGNTPLHLLVAQGCFIEDLIKYIAAGDSHTTNNDGWTPRDMLYYRHDIVGDQVQIKMELDGMISTDQSRKLWSSSRKKSTSSSLAVLPASKREKKDILFNEVQKVLMEKKNAKMEEDLQRYREGTNSQIVVSALITTITFTVGFTIPGGLHQSGESNQGLAVLSKKAAFKIFMIADAFALLLSICSLFVYFLENMSDNFEHVTRLHATTLGLNIASIMLTMFVFMTGTYVVFSDSLFLSITIFSIGSLFLIFVILQLLRIAYERRARKNDNYKKEA
ncbi:uncharacterized protein LOC108200886 [Daucus carota subsp. sativus]|uniref:uncharacterized protein LOC108200886 n=1 Tax=Daucus carota subsp. sativus TaxID=79200 RepID=UPI0007EFBFE7|nr:PREDICTED: uncharacterized protein LOC108200886 [Daucus carota subsp. sativus]